MLSSLKRVRSSFTTLKSLFGSGRASASTSPRPQDRQLRYKNETGSRYYRVRFAREARRAMVKRQMRTERRWARGRNTRGLPVGMGEHMRGPELTVRLNAQIPLRRDRLPKIVRRVGALCFAP